MTTAKTYDNVTITFTPTGGCALTYTNIVKVAIPTPSVTEDVDVTVFGDTYVKLIPHPLKKAEGFQFSVQGIVATNVGTEGNWVVSLISGATCDSVTFDGYTKEPKPSEIDVKGERIITTDISVTISGNIR